MIEHTYPHPTGHRAAQSTAPARRGRILFVLLPVLVSGCFGHAPSLGEPVETTDVSMAGAWLFQPAWIRVDQNATVNWTNDGDAYHTVTIRGLGFNAVLKPGEKASLTFSAPGTYEYVCEYHQPHMAGRVTVMAIVQTRVAMGSTATTTNVTN